MKQRAGLILLAVILMLLPAVPAAGTATASAQPVLIGPTYAMLNTEYTWTLVQPPTGSVSYRMQTVRMLNRGEYQVTGSAYCGQNSDGQPCYTFTAEGNYVLTASWLPAWGSAAEEVTILIRAISPAGQLGSKVKDIAARCRASGARTDYEIALWLHDYLTGHAHYDTTYTEFGAEGVLLKGYGVCDSYSKAYQLLLGEFGIPCFKQDGTLAMQHAWNVVMLGGKWYSIDVTWDDPVPIDPAENTTVSGYERHDYFALPDDLFSLDHDYAVTYPCVSMDDNYYVRSGLPKDCSRFADDGWPDSAEPGLAEQAAAGLAEISVDTSRGYCTLWEETEAGTAWGMSDAGKDVIFTVMAMEKSRQPMTGPDGSRVWYAFTYDRRAERLTGTKQQHAPTATPKPVTPTPKPVTPTAKPAGGSASAVTVTAGETGPEVLRLLSEIGSGRSSPLDAFSAGTQRRMKALGFRNAVPAGCFVLKLGGTAADDGLPVTVKLDFARPEWQAAAVFTAFDSRGGSEDFAVSGTRNGGGSFTFVLDAEAARKALAAETVVLAVFCK